MDVNNASADINASTRDSTINNTISNENDEDNRNRNSEEEARRAVDTETLIVSDTAVVDEDGTISIDVLANDTDAEGNKSPVLSVTQAENGTVIINDNGTIQYTPNQDFNGEDSFTYTNEEGNTETVIVTVNPVNDGPDAIDDSYEMTTVLLGSKTNTDTDSLADWGTLNQDGCVSIDTDGVTGTITATRNGSETNVSYDAGDNDYGLGARSGEIDMNESIVMEFDNSLSNATIGLESLYGRYDEHKGQDASVEYKAYLNGVLVASGNVVSDVNNTDGDGDRATNTLHVDTAFDKIVFASEAESGANANFTIAYLEADTAISLTTNEDTSITIDSATLIGNDLDIDGDNLTITSVQDATNGDVELVNGEVVFTPDANYNGPATFTYTISDGNGGEDTATVTLNVLSVNDIPTIDTIASESVQEDGSVTINYSTDDIDSDSVTLTASANNGVVTVNDDGTLTFEPNENYNGSDTITLVATDSDGGVSTKDIAVTITPTNDAPTAVDDNGTQNILLGSKTNTDTDSLADWGTLNQDGCVSIDTDGVTGTITATRNGSETNVSYDAGDNDYGLGARSGEIDMNESIVMEFDNSLSNATIGLESLYGRYDEHKGQDASVEYKAYLNGVLVASGNVVSDVNNTDGDGDRATNTLHVDTAFDKIVFASEAESGANANFTIAYLEATANTEIVTPEDTPITILASDILANDSDIDGDNISLVSVSNPTNGTVEIDVDGNVVFTPSDDYNGPATFDYTISDGNGGEDTATVTLNVTPVPDAPDAIDDGNTGARSGQEVVGLYYADSDVNILDSIDDPLVTTSDHYYFDHNSLGVTGYNYMGDASDTRNDQSNSDWFVEHGIDISELRGGTIVFADGTTGDIKTASNGVKRYLDDNDPSNDYTESAYIYYNTNETPITTNEDTALVIDVLENDFDVDGDTLTITSVETSSNTHGSVEIVDGKILFTPDADYNGPATFDYTISDGNGGEDTATVNINVAAVADAPDANDDNMIALDTNSDFGDFTGEGADAGVIVTGLFAVGSTLNLLDGAPELNTLNDYRLVGADRGYNYMGEHDYFADNGINIGELRGGVVTFSDGTVGIIDTASNGVDRANGNDESAYIYYKSYENLDINDLALSTNDNTPVVIDVLANDVDVDGDSLSITSISNVTNGTAVIVVVDGVEKVEFTPDAGYSGPASFAYTISDGTDSDSAQVNLVVNDTTAPNAPIITNIVDNAGDYSSVTLFGTGEPGATITLMSVSGSTTNGNNTNPDGIDTDIIPTTIVAEDGTWSYDISGLENTQVNDNEFFKAVQTDAAGNESLESNTVHYWHGTWSNVSTEVEDDFIVMGSGNDTIRVNDDDINDSIVVDGGDGNDTAIINSNYKDNVIQIIGENVLVDEANGDINEFRNMETINFNDGSYNVETGGFTYITDLGGDQNGETITFRITGDHYDPVNVSDEGTGSPKYKIMINGEPYTADNGDSTFSVNANRGQVSEDGTHMLRDVNEFELVSLNVPDGTEINSISIKFINDAWDGPSTGETSDRDGDGITGEDRNLVVDSLNIGGVVNVDGTITGGTTYEAEDTDVAEYLASNGNDVSGRETMAWSGTMTFFPDGKDTVIEGDINNDVNNVEDGDYIGDLITSDVNDNIFIGDDVADARTVSTNGGDDTVYIYDDVKEGSTVDTGSGDDFITIGGNDKGLKIDGLIDGGDDYDTLALGQENIDLGLLSSDIKNIESIDLNQGDQTLSLNVEDVLNVTDEDNTLRIEGDSGDTVNIVDAEWKLGDFKTDAETNISYQEYVSNDDPTVTIEVNSEIHVDES